MTDQPQPAVDHTSTDVPAVRSADEPAESPAGRAGTVVAHVTSVHQAGDNRIHWRQCASLAEAGFDVRLIVLGPPPRESAPGVTVVSAGKPMGRLPRMFLGALRVFRTTRAQRPKVAHLHDPELMILVPFLRLAGIRVVVDLHEDPSLDIQDKALPGPVRVLGLLWYRLLLLLSRPFAGLFVVAWPHPRDPAPADRIIEVRNYPSSGEFDRDRPVPYDQRGPVAVSVGTNGRDRCYAEMIEAAGLLGERGTINIVGHTNPADLADRMAPQIEASGVRLTPRQNHDGVAAVLGEARVGLCLLYPTKQYVLAEPTKLFEYLSVGLPIVGADMGPTKEVVERHRCGILVDPKDPAAIADAVATILEEPELAATFRSRALEASVNYTWEAQAARLVAAYDRLLGRATDPVATP
ncbi:MAG: glycosyltransferase [Actinomycetota bacterium]